MDTRGEKSDRHRKPQEERKHPSDLEVSLDPDHLAGQNIGVPLSDRELAVPTAFDVKTLHRRLRAFRDDELKEIPIIPNGARLQQGATYLDLADDPPHELTAMGGMTARAGHWFVPKDRVPYELWNRLLGRERP